MRIALRKAEEHARHQSYETPPELIDLLKRTYHIEEIAFETKRKLAENAMLTAKEQVGNSVPSFSSLQSSNSLDE